MKPLKVGEKVPSPFNCKRPFRQSTKFGAIIKALKVVVFFYPKARYTRMHEQRHAT